MEGRRVLADTTLFIEHLRAKDKTSTHLYNLTSRFQVETCAIVAAEIYYGARKAEDENQARSVSCPFIIHPFTGEMAARQCAVLPELVKKNRVPDLRDLMIAVTAIDLGLSIATLNRAHFEFISGLRLVDISVSI